MGWLNCRHYMVPIPCHHDRSDILQHHDPYIFHDCIHLSIHLLRLTRLWIPDYSLVLLDSFELGMEHWRGLVRMQRLVCHILMSTPSALALISFLLSTKQLYHSVHSGCCKLGKLHILGRHLMQLRSSSRRRKGLGLDRVPPYA